MKRILTKVARELRQDRNPHEVRLWARLRNRQFLGLKFYRQFPIGPYIGDFVCRDKKFVIEVDGGGHDEAEQKRADATRDEFLRSEGYRIVRVWTSDIHANIDSVLEYIRSSIE